MSQEYLLQEQAAQDAAEEDRRGWPSRRGQGARPAERFSVYLSSADRHATADDEPELRYGELGSMGTLNFLRVNSILLLIQLRVVALVHPPQPLHQSRRRLQAPKVRPQTIGNLQETQRLVLENQIRRRLHGLRASRYRQRHPRRPLYRRPSHRAR
jgi:hypothetical protein